MTERVFHWRIKERWEEDKFVCVGLDSDYTQISEAVRNKLIQQGTAKNISPEEILLGFNQAIIDATWDLVCAYKPNIAFYEGLGLQGLSALIRTVTYINQRAPGVPVIGDMKRADIGNTNLGYVRAAFEVFGFDAITVHPYLGGEALQPFLDRADKGIFVLSRTSNPGAGEFQDRRDESDRLPLFKRVAEAVVEWNKNENCGIVVGATYPEELGEVRQIVGDMPILIPGIGAQGGDVEKTVKAGKDSKKQGMIINSSRGIIFASKGSDFAEVARQETLKLSEMINQYR